MKEITIEQIKKIVEVIAKDFRLLHGNPTLSTIENPKIKGTLTFQKGIILYLTNFKDDGEDIEVAKKGLGFSIAKGLGITDNPNDFK